MKSKMPEKALVLCLSDPSKSPRPLRAIKLLKLMGYNVTVFSAPPENNIEIDQLYEIKTPSLALPAKLFRKLLGLVAFLIPIKQFGHFLDSIRYGFYSNSDIIKNNYFDLYLVENLSLLPLVLKYKSNNKSRVVIDAREYYPKQYENNNWFKLIEKPRIETICREMLKRCDLVLTVSEGLRDEYRKNYGIDPIVYRSVPYYTELAVRSTNPDAIRMVYHGLAHKDRQLELLIDVFSLLDARFHLDLILVGKQEYQNELKFKAKLHNRISFSEPVPLSQIVKTISKYDIGFFYYEPLNFNLKHALPNKFFECIQARLMLAIGPSPDMASLVNKYKCGIVSEEFTVASMASALNRLTAASIDYYKRQSDLAARELCFEKEQNVFFSEIRKLQYIE